MSQRGFEPLTFELKARCSANWATNPMFFYSLKILYSSVRFAVRNGPYKYFFICFCDWTLYYQKKYREILFTTDNKKKKKIKKYTSSILCQIVVKKRNSKKSPRPLLGSNWNCFFYFSVFWYSRCLFIFFAQDLIQINAGLKYKNSTLLNCNNCFQSALRHQYNRSSDCNWSTNQKRKSKCRHKSQRCELVEQQMSPELITVKSSPQTDGTEAITNGLKQNKKRCHWPTWSTWQEETYKTYSLTTNSLIGNSRKQSNTQSQSKTSSSCNCRKKRELSKRVTYLQKEKLNRLPNNSCFSTRKRISSPCCWQTICCLKCMNLLFLVLMSVFNTLSNRTVCSLTPFQMNTFQSLSIPKKTHRFTKTRKCTISCSCSGMIIRMISSLNQNSKCNSQ